MAAASAPLQTITRLTPLAEVLAAVDSDVQPVTPRTLDVTAAAGRNRAFGERVGKGRPAKQVAAEMLAAGELTEGYPAIASAWRYAGERGVTKLPLLAALHAVVWENAPVGEALAGLKLG